jgi:Flp pilus assembly protein TadG
MSEERGATLVEAAISITLLLLVVFGIVELGRFLHIMHGADTAAREGARYGIAVGDSANGIPRYTDCDEIVAAAIALSGLADLDPADISVTYDDGAGTQLHDCSGGNPPESTIPHGSRVVVDVSRTYQFLTPLAGPIFGPLTVTVSDSRTIFKEDSP